MRISRRTLAASVAALALAGGPVSAADAIKIGNTIPYSGPLSAYGTIAKTMDAYLKMVNEQGGVDGHQIEWISYDDAYSPPKTVEQTRRLIESDEVQIISNPLGTATTLAVRKYVNAKKIPQIFIASGSSHWNEVDKFPYTMGLQPTYRTEAEIYGRHFLQEMPKGRIGVLYQNDDFGRDYLAGLKDAFGDAYDAQVVPAPYDASDPTVDSQIVNLKAADVDAVMIGASAKFAAQAIRKIYELGWNVPRYESNTATSLGAVLKPAGLEASTGLITAGYMKDLTDPQWDDDPEMKAYKAFMAERYPDGDPISSINGYAYMAATTLVEILRRCEGDYSSENFMKAAESLKQYPAPLMLPGITLTTGPEDHLPIQTMRLQRFNGEKWESFGENISAEAD